MVWMVQIVNENVHTQNSEIEKQLAAWYWQTWSQNFVFRVLSHWDFEIALKGGKLQFSKISESFKNAFKLFNYLKVRYIDKEKFKISGPHAFTNIISEFL